MENKEEVEEDTIELEGASHNALRRDSSIETIAELQGEIDKLLANIVDDDDDNEEDDSSSSNPFSLCEMSPEPEVVLEEQEKEEREEREEEEKEREEREEEEEEKKEEEDSCKRERRSCEKDEEDLKGRIPRATCECFFFAS